MNKYTIYCTPSQTKKAFNFGASLEIGEGKGTILCRLQNYHTYKRCVIPTAEQMLGWLRTKGFKFILSDEIDGNEGNNWWVGINGELITQGCNENKELAAIDAALDYLSDSNYDKI